MPHVLALDLDASCPVGDSKRARWWRLLAELDALSPPHRVVVYTRDPATAPSGLRGVVTPVGVEGPLGPRLRTDLPSALQGTRRPRGADGVPLLLDATASEPQPPAFAGAAGVLVADARTRERVLAQHPNLHPERVAVLGAPEDPRADPAGWAAAARRLAALQAAVIGATTGARPAVGVDARPAARVVVSVVSTGEADRLVPLMTSLEAQGLGDDLKVVVVCNQPGDGSAALVRANFPRALVVEQPQRRSFSHNHNTGIAAVRSEFGMVLNPDVILEPRCVEALLELMAEQPRCGLAAPLLLYPGGSPQPSARRFPRPLGSIVRRTPLRAVVSPARVDARHHLAPPGAPRRVHWVLGACLMVRRTAWDEVGGFDEGFRPLYVEDIDLGWRLWQRGWEVWQTPHARAIHEHQAASDGAFFHRRTLWHLRGVLRFVQRHPSVLRSRYPALAPAD